MGRDGGGEDGGESRREVGKPTGYAGPGPADLLPDQTSDDLAAGWGERRETDDELLQRYLADRPPHHGD